MAIVNISRITHRKGTNENLPQLAVSEIGWSVDTRQLYIGNGGDGAPQVENVEILTSYSNLLSDTQTYTYRDAAVGYEANNIVSRTLQAKLDDFVSVRDYGALGDNNNDDTEAINNAIVDLYTRSSSFQARRTLFFPAGIYLVDTNQIKLPPYITFLGEGNQASVIKRTDTADTAVARTVDSLLQTGASIGTNAATSPQRMTFINMAFEVSGEIDAFLLDRAKNVHFENCVFKGNKTTLPSTSGSDKAALRIASGAGNIASDVKFTNCRFIDHTYGVQIDDEVNGITFCGCDFSNLYKAIVIGENTVGNYPTGIRIISSTFNNIHSQAIHIFSGVSEISSAFNYFGDVGTSGNGSGNPSSDVITFAGDGCYSVGDSFKRNDTDDETFSRINNSNNANFSVDTSKDMAYGRWTRTPGAQATLTDNTASATSTGLTFSDTGEKYVEIEYSIIRDSRVRNGLLRITHDSSNQGVDDEYSENNGSVGITFSVSNASNTTTLNYTSTSTGTDATFRYSIRKII